MSTNKNKTNFKDQLFNFMFPVDIYAKPFQLTYKGK
jgi:hypothetical protein